MEHDRRNQSSVGARMRSPGSSSWGSWKPGDAAPSAPIGPAPLADRSAIFDPLTGLPNRLLFADRLDGALKRATRSRQHVALATLRVAGLAKLTVDHGPGAAVALVTTIAQRLGQVVRSSDTVACLQADEFAVVCENLMSPGAVEDVARRIEAAVSQRCTLLIGAEGRPVEATPRVSIGVAIYPQHGKGADELLAVAGLATRQAENLGHACVYRGAVDAAPRSGTA